MQSFEFSINPQTIISLGSHKNALTIVPQAIEPKYGQNSERFDDRAVYPLEMRRPKMSVQCAASPTGREGRQQKHRERIHADDDKRKCPPLDLFS
jgi:hypothetical protein